MTYYKNLQLLFENKTEQNKTKKWLSFVWLSESIDREGMPTTNCKTNLATLLLRWQIDGFQVPLAVSQQQKCLLPFCSSKQANICWFSVGSAHCGPTRDRAQHTDTPVWRMTPRNHHEILRQWPGFRNPAKVWESILKMRGSLWKPISETGLSRKLLLY